VAWSSLKEAHDGSFRKPTFPPLPKTLSPKASKGSEGRHRRVLQNPDPGFKSHRRFQRKAHQHTASKRLGGSARSLLELLGSPGWTWASHRARGVIFVAPRVAALSVPPALRPRPRTDSPRSSSHRTPVSKDAPLASCSPSRPSPQRHADTQPLRFLDHPAQCLDLLFRRFGIEWSSDINLRGAKGMDLVYIGLAILFFLTTWGLVELCDRLMGVIQ
jgi:hypothetical protein